MKFNGLSLAFTLTAFSIFSCTQHKPDPNKADSLTDDSKQQVDLPAPYQTKAVKNYCKVIGWGSGTTPKAPAGFTVNAFAASGLDNPRNIYIAPNGDIFISQANTEVTGIKKIGSDIMDVGKSQKLGKSANNILLLRDTNGDGKADVQTVFLSNLNQPYGMLIAGNSFYVANTDGVWKYPYKQGQTKITEPGAMILSLPAGGYNNHWTRNLRLSPDGKQLFIGVGSGSNVAEHGMDNEKRRADVLVTDLDGKGEHIYASGLRNPAGLAFQPGTGTLWAAVNERDNLGDDLVPDYMTSVKQGGFYGWPYSYWGQHTDPRIKAQRPELVSKAIVPDVSLGAHTASLGLAFYDGKTFPKTYQDGAFVGQHGSWNRSVLAGYKVVFVPFANGKPSSKPQDFLTGFFADTTKKEVHGRPVSVAVAKDGALLVADDTGNRIWRVSAAK